jgi:hypothetical protein
LVAQCKGPTINAKGTFMPPVAIQGNQVHAGQKRKIFDDEQNLSGNTSLNDSGTQPPEKKTVMTSITIPKQVGVFFPDEKTVFFQAPKFY